jgi:NDP-sugar pyrophosphorylase family protein
MQALILAGGLGTRLRSVVSDRPKPMAEVGDAPFLAYQLDYLRRFGVDRVVLCVGYRYQQVRDYFGDGAGSGLRIDYSIEAEPLGTGGALRLAEPLIEEDAFLLLNGDSYFDLDLGCLIRAHASNRARDPHCLGTLALVEVADARAYGTVALAEDARVTGFYEKADEIVIFPSFVNAGIYALQKSVNEYIPTAVRVSLERDTFPAILASQQTLFGYPASGFFVDIGTPEGYSRFREHFEELSDDHSQQGTLAHQLRGRGH